MGQILPGVVVAFENPKGGVGKSTLTALFAGYIHSQSNEEGGLSIAVVDIDDMQNTIGKLREDEAEDGIMKKEEEYEVINISSSEFINQLDFLQDNYDIILVDFPGNLKQNGVVETLHFVDVIIIPFEPNQTDLRPTLTFYYNIYEGIIESRRKIGKKTTVRGVMNRVLPNVLEFKEILKNKKTLPFELMQNYIKDSRVDYQRNLSTLSKAYHHPCDAFCEEVLELICNHIGNKAMATNKERTSSAAMRKLLLQSASKKEQEIQQIGSVAESTIPQPAIEHPIHEEVKESAPVKETVQEPQPEQMEKPESKPSVQSSPKTEESKVCGKKFSEYLEERKLKNTEVIRISSETHRKLKQIAMATGLGMHNIANNILEDILTSHNKEIQAILKKYMSI